MLRCSCTSRTVGDGGCLFALPMAADSCCSRGTRLAVLRGITQVWIIDAVRLCGHAPKLWCRPAVVQACALTPWIAAQSAWPGLIRPGGAYFGVFCFINAICRGSAVSCCGISHEMHAVRHYKCMQCRIPVRGSFVAIPLELVC